MPALTGLALTAAALLALAGGQKLLDPTMTVGALRALRWPASVLLVRLGSAAELMLGVLAIAVGGRLVWGAVAVSYVAFSGFVVAALRSGTMIGSCGCFGRDETPPHPGHVALNLVLAGVAVAVAVLDDAPPIDALVERPGDGVLIAGLAGVALSLLLGAYIELPRLLAARRDH